MTYVESAQWLTRWTADSASNYTLTLQVLAIDYGNALSVSSDLALIREKFRKTLLHELIGCDRTWAVDADNNHNQDFP